MTEEKKQELRQLLEEAIENVEIESRDGQALSIAEYGEQLRERWASYSAESKSVKDFTFSITIDDTTLKLHALIKSELGQFINEDRIVTAIFYAIGGSSEGVRLNSFLIQLLKIAIAQGTEKAVLAFDRCTKDTHVSMQCVALIEGIKIEEAVQVFEGGRLVPISDTPSVNSSLLPRIPPPGISEDFYHSQTLFIVDYTISPLFHKPVLPPVFLSEKELFRFEGNNSGFSYFHRTDFFKTFCDALSLVCNSPMQISMEWELVPEDTAFNVGNGPGYVRYHRLGLFGKFAEVGKSDIEKATCLYDILNKNSDVSDKLRIPINRWIRSKISTTPADKMIDLGIALEALYTLKSERGITATLSARAAWHLGKDKERRKELLTKFRQIYNCRSNAVHRGELAETVTFGTKPIPVLDFIKNAQKLCRESILKVLNAKEFPNRDYWDSLIVGGEED